MADINSGIRKAAVLVASLDEQIAKVLLDGMEPAQAKAVRRAVENLGDLDTAEQNDVIDEFFRIGPVVPEKTPSGLNPDGCQTASGKEPAPMESLCDLPAQLLAGFLEREHPQTVALVVSNLPSQRAAEVLATLPADLQIDVAHRLVELDEADPEILREVERGIAARLCEHDQINRRRAQGITALNNILDSASPQAKRHILANLSRHRQLAGKLQIGRPRPISFSDLELLDAASLTVVLHHAEREVLVLALAGARPQLAERAFELFPSHEAQALRKSLCDLGPTRLSDVEEAQRELTELAAQLENRGEIVIAKRGHLSVAV